MKYKKVNIIIFFASIILMLAFSTHASAQTYYVSNQGNDEHCSGQSGEDWSGDTSSTGQDCAWATIEKVNDFNFQPGDDVYFESGGTWNVQSVFLDVDWSGTSSDITTIGAYYMAGTTPVYGSDTSHPKPIFDGHWDMASEGDAISKISIWGKSYIIVQDLEIKRSSGGGIGSYRAYAPTWAPCDHVSFLRNTVHGNFSNGLSQLETDNGSIENNEVYDNSKILIYQDPSCLRTDGTTGPWRWEGDCNYGAGIFNAFGDNSRIRNNLVHENYGEGIDCGVKNRGVIVEHNTVYDNWSVNLYTHNAEDLTIRYNLAYYTNNETFWRWNNYIMKKAPSSNIILGSEDWAYCDTGWSTNGWDYRDNFYVYGNVVAGGGDNVYIAGGDNLVTPCGTGHLTVNNMNFHNNVLVQSRDESIFGNLHVIGSFTNSRFYNNIITQSAGYTAMDGGTGITYDYNLWSANPGNSFIGAHDYGSYVQASLIKSTGWDNLMAGDLNSDDFMLLSDSPGTNVGYSLVNPPPSGEPYPYSVTYDIDIRGVSRPQSSGWDIGAYEFIDEDIIAPGVPTGLSVR